MRSIKRRVLSSFLFIIILSIAILDLLLFVAVKKYYYDNSEKVLRNQMETATSFYNKYFTSTSLQENINDNVDSFWNQTDAEVQVYNLYGKLIMDSIGAEERDTIYSDVNDALGGKTSRWIGNVNYSKNKVMSVSTPIIVNHKIIGVLRYIISLERVNLEIRNISVDFIGISIIVLIIGIFLSLILAKSIINPIMELTIVAEKMASGNLTVRSSIKDDDEVGKLAQTLNYMVEELSKRDKLKDEFISSVSHELRTPLTAIKGWAITLDDEKTDISTLKTGLKIIEKESDRLGKMVEGLLDFSKLQNDKVKLIKRETNMKEFINYIQACISQRATRENKLLNVTYEIEQNIVYIDQDKMKQVLINLIDNAFRFTGENGSISLIISEDDENIQIVVEDNGCGISDQDLPKVKEKFYKGQNAKSQNGIGLSICDEIIKLHDGKLIIESKVGIGTRITVLIPRERS